VALGVILKPLGDLMLSASRSDYYSHIVLIPLVTAYLLYQKRREIFLAPERVHPLGLILAFCGAALFGFGYSRAGNLTPNDYASFLTFSAIVFWTGGYVLLYGIRGFRKASFPILFLVFMIPIPGSIMGKIIYLLQVGSAEATEMLFTLAGVPFQREGFIFRLPGVSIEIAEVCSGIRSSLALFITSILAGHFFLDRFWKKVVLALLVFPVTVLKNGIRIMTLTLLAAYVDGRFLTGGFLHQSGGFLFFIPALVILGLALWGLRKGAYGERPKA
jgi:exosortase